jgi:CheY-like chemotaxis protein
MMPTKVGSIGLRAALAWMMLCLPSIILRINDTNKHKFSLQPLMRIVLMALLFGVLVFALAGPAYGAIAKVKDIDITSDITTGTSIDAIVPAGGVAAGNTVIVAFVMDDTDGTVSCADQQGNTYGLADVDQNNINQVRTVIFSAYITNALSSGDWIRVTHPSIGDRVIHASEFSGLANSTVDQTGSNSGNATTLTSGNTTSTTAEPNELLIGAIGVAGPSSDTFTPTVETPVWNKTEVTTSNDNIRLNSLYRIVTSTGQYAASGTNPRRKFAAGIATYKAPAASLDQVHYRWRENDDTESAAAWQEDEDTKAALRRGYANRIRFLVENEGEQPSGGVTYQLQVAETATCSSGSYSAVPTDTSGDWQMTASQLVEGAATTNLAGSFTKPGGYTWVDGEQRETSNTTGSITLDVQEFTEIEFSIQTTGNVTYGGDYCFRLYNNTGSAPLDNYTAYAEAEVRCNFEYRRLLTVDKDQVGVDNNPGTLSNYPVLVHLTGDWLKTDPTGNIQNADGYDIVFRYDGGSCTSGNPCDALDFEIEKYDGTNGELIAWVRIPSLSKSADTDFYIYYGNVCVTDDSQNATGVWDTNYKGVWHLKEDPEAGAPQFLDSTTNPNDGTANSLAIANQVAGQIDGSLEFDDTNERHVSVSDHSSLQLSTNIAVSAWVNTSDAETDTAIIVNKWSSGTSARNYWLGKLDDNVLAFFVDDTQTVTAGLSLINDGAWHHVTGVADVANSLLRIYVDGLEKNTTTYSGTSRTGTNALHIGHGSGEVSQEFDGIIDEVRVSSTARTADWIKTDYSNQYDPTKAAGCIDNGFICMGSEETDPTTAVSLISFTARGQGNAVAIEWETAAEFDNIGFHLYRASSPGGPYSRLTDKLISARPRQGQGANYSFLDSDVTVGSLYYYRLEDIDAYGKHTMHGPISVDWDADDLPDDWEITHGLNPWVNDADLDHDGDGLTNYEEYERDLDPFNPDTDGDGILDGAEDGRLPVPEDNGSHSISRGVEVLAADESGITIALNTSGFEAEVVTVGGAEYERLYIADYVHGYTRRVGAPQLPLKGLLIDVPAGKAAELAVLNSAAEPYSGYRIYPVPEAVLDAQDGMAAVGTAFVQDDLAYSTDGFYPQDAALLGQSYVFRDQVKQQVIFYPLRFNPAGGQLFLYRRIELRIDFVDARYARVSPPVQMPWQPPQTIGDVLSSMAMGFAATPVLVNPISPILSSLGATVAILWSPPESAGGNAYKILTDAEGIYRITKDYLDTNGVDTDAIDLSQVRIYNLGEEIAIDIFDQNGDDQFDAVDYFTFYAQPVSSPYAKYSAENVYWMTLSGGAGLPKRMATDDGAPTGGLPATDFADTASHEQDIIYWLKAPGADSIERWFFNIFVQGTEHVGGGQPKPFTIAVPGPVSTGTLTILVAGQTDTDHELRVAINGSEQSFMWSGINYYEATLDNVALFAGDNTVTLQCLSADGNDSMAVDWFEVAYRREYVAAANTLKFSPDSGSRYNIDDFTDNNLLAFDISDPINVVKIDNAIITGTNPYSFEFEPAAAGSAYLVLASEVSKIPVGLIEDTAADLAHNASGADYMLITHRDLGWDQNGDQLAWLTDLVAHREAQGLRVFVADIEDIYDEFSFGIKSPRALKDFLTYAYGNWTLPAPRYVLLVGDSTYDPKDLWLNSDTTAYLPTYLMFTEHKGETVTDEWFVTFSGDDAVADMHIGRLPAAEAAQAAVMVNKILTYETTPNSKFSDPNAWEKNILLVADNQRVGADYLYEADFATMNEDAAAMLPPIMNPYAGYLGIHYADAAYLTDFITTTLNTEGALMVNFAGHGATQVWAEEHILDTGALSGLTNTAELPFFVSMSCETGFFAYPEVWFYPSLAEALLRSNAGAVATLMPTGMSSTESQRILNKALFEHIFNDNIRELGPAIAAAKQTLLANGDAYFEQVANTFLLFGDPAMALKVPQPHIPKGVAVEHRDGGVRIRWQAVLDCDNNSVSGYNVYRSLSAGGIYTKINSALITGTQYLDTGSAGVSAQSTAGSAAAGYYYGVTAVDSSGDESAQTLGISPPAPQLKSDWGPISGCFITTTTPAAQFKITFKALVVIVSIILGFLLLQVIVKPQRKKNADRKKMNPFNELKNVKTLLVDDDEFIRDSLGMAFANNGCSLQLAETAEEGLQAIQDQQFDIIISDLRLPGMNGLDFLKLTTVTQPQAVKFLITAYRDDHIFSEAIRLGVHEFIEKPFAVKVLINLLALAIKRQARRQAIAGI